MTHKEFKQRIQEEILLIHQNSKCIPYVDNYVEYTLGKQLNDGTAFGKTDERQVNELGSLIIRLLREQKIIRGNDDPLVIFMKECKETAMGGKKVTKDIVEFYRRVADAYIASKKYGEDSRYYQPFSLTYLFQKRNNFLQYNVELSESVMAMLDYMDAHNKEFGKIPVTRRFTASEVNNYYSEKDNSKDNVVSRMFNDIKQYLPTQSYMISMKLSKKELPLSVITIFIQAVIMIENGVSFDYIYNFLIERNIEQLPVVLEQIANSSKKGTEFSRYVHSISTLDNKQIKKNPKRKKDRSKGAVIE